MNQLKQELHTMQSEARRCLYCVDAPCRAACPAGVDPSQFIRHLRYGDLKSAKAEIKKANVLGSVCGSLCPAGELCQKACTLNGSGAPIRIRELQKFCCENATWQAPTGNPTGKRVAIVGGGPAGLACAVELAARGIATEIFERDSALAGVVAAEIPTGRIDPAVLENELRELQSPLIAYHLGHSVDKEALHTLADRFDFVFLATGLMNDITGGIQPNQKNILLCSSFLRDVKNGRLSALSGAVCVIGGGDSAMDAARVALELGADSATIAYRRTRAELPASGEEFLAAAERGVAFRYLLSPKSAVATGDGVTATFSKNALTEADESGRRGFRELPDSDFCEVFSTLILSIGKKAESLLPGEVDPDTGRVGSTNIFVGGDYKNRGATIVQAVGEGKKAAEVIAALL